VRVGAAYADYQNSTELAMIWSPHSRTVGISSLEYGGIVGAIYETEVSAHLDKLSGTATMLCRDSSS
jgi:hypothetical protein